MYLISFNVASKYEEDDVRSKTFGNITILRKIFVKSKTICTRFK